LKNQAPDAHQIIESGRVEAIFYYPEVRHQYHDLTTLTATGRRRHEQAAVPRRTDMPAQQEK
jgi:hypothetical protein